MWAVRGMVLLGGLLLLAGGCCGPRAGTANEWHADYAEALAVPPIVFHCDHGVLTGSYLEGVETVTVRYKDVCAQLGHICLCGAGGYRIASQAVEALRRRWAPLEREEFILISAKDHTVSDVIGSVLGCVRRASAEKSQVFIDESVTAPRREYHYFIGYPPSERAVHVVYRKHLLIGHDKMDELWKIELAFEDDPSSVSAEDVGRYQEAMRQMVHDVLLDRVPGLITVESMPYEEFQARLDAVRS